MSAGGRGSPWSLLLPWGPSVFLITRRQRSWRGLGFVAKRQKV